MNRFYLKLKPMSREHTLFERVFNVRLHKFGNALTGFDVIGLDDALKTPEGKSLGEHITEKTDADTCAYIKSLI